MHLGDNYHMSAPHVKVVISRYHEPFGTSPHCINVVDGSF